jgi:hypothetical protein
MLPASPVMRSPRFGALCNFGLDAESNQHPLYLSAQVTFSSAAYVEGATGV